MPILRGDCEQGYPAQRAEKWSGTRSITAGLCRVSSIPNEKRVSVDP